MSGALALDLVLAALAVGVAAWTIAARDVFAAVVGFVAYGLVLALVWVRLAAVDVALTEASLGAVTGVLLLSAVPRLRSAAAPPEAEQAGAGLRAVAAVACALVSAGIAAALLALPDPAPGVAPAVAEALPATGLGNPVTAVLMAFRAIDTLLEKIVLLVALVAVGSLAPDAAWGGRSGAAAAARPDDPLAFLARLLPPIGAVIAIYLLWTATDAPGGAFPAGTLLAAMWILARLAGLVDAPASGARALRLALVAGPLAFLAVGLAGLALAGGFLAYPDGWAKPLIVAIEVAMTLTIAATLALLASGPPEREPSGASEREPAGR